MYEGECMSKKIVVAVFFVLALLVCYRVEQNIYENKAFSYFEKLRMDTQKGDPESKETLQGEALSENLTAEQNQKIAYLTFDDGPSKVTEDVLSVLEEKNVNATFFLIGNQINDETIPILKRSVKDGNCLGIHTYCHECKVIYCSADSYLKDFDEAYEAIKDNVGVEPKIFRFPWGSANGFLRNIGDEVIANLEKRGFNYYDWNVSAEDSVGSPSSWSIMNNIHKDYKKYKKPIILMHDSPRNSLSAKLLPQIIDELKAAGYTFDTLDHMASPYQWPRD